MPEDIIPHSLMSGLERYANKRISELNQQIIRDRWHTIELEKAINGIHVRQQCKK